MRNCVQLVDFIYCSCVCEQSLVEMTCLNSVANVVRLTEGGDAIRWVISVGTRNVHSARPNQWQFPVGLSYPSRGFAENGSLIF